MKFAEVNTQIREEWDAFVHLNKGKVFSQSTYLDSCAENWIVLYSDDETGGMACPFTVRAGQKMLYTPFFLRAVEWLGVQPDWEELFRFLKKEFSVCDLQITNSISESTDKVHQALEVGESKLNQQAKRSLKKATSYQLSEGVMKAELFGLIRAELSKKIDTINNETLPVLEKLVDAYLPKGLIQLNLFQNESWQGALWLIQTEDTLLYLKGTVCAEAKSNGGMYLLMQHAIQLATEKQLLFDFGGSNVENVRRFNLHFGAKDIVYSRVSWNTAPIWWNFLRFLKKKWNKK